MEFYGTLGDACWERETLEKLFRAGMTGARLNLSLIHISEPTRH